MARSMLGGEGRVGALNHIENGRAVIAVLLAAVLATSVLAACGREPRDSVEAPEAVAGAFTDPPTLSEVCGLLSRAEVEATLGTKVAGKPVETPLINQIGVPGLRGCTFRGVGGGSLDVGLASALGPEAFKKGAARRHTGSQPVRNLGDEALVFSGGVLLVRQDDSVLFLRVAPREADASEALEAAPKAIRERNVTLALKALKRLEQRRSRG